MSASKAVGQGILTVVSIGVGVLFAVLDGKSSRNVTIPTPNYNFQPPPSINWQPPPQPDFSRIQEQIRQSQLQSDQEIQRILQRNLRQQQFPGLEPLPHVYIPPSVRFPTTPGVTFPPSESPPSTPPSPAVEVGSPAREK